MKTGNYVFGWLLVVAGLLLAAMNILRAGRPGDRVLAWVSCAGCVGWILVAVSFGRLAGSLFDPRALSHEAITLVLRVFSLRGTHSGGVEWMGLGTRSARTS
jgi:hypothetical protein